MSIATLVRNRLLSDATIAAAVVDRVYPVTSGNDKPVYPMIIFHHVGKGSMQSMTGPSGLGMPHVQINIAVDQFDYDLLEVLEDRVRVVMQTYRDIANGFQAAIVRGGGDLPVDETTRAIGKFVDFELHVAEAKT